MLSLDSIAPTTRPADPASYLEQTIYLSDEVSPNSPGWLSLDGQPWARDILRAFVDPSVHQIVLQCGTQLGKSLTLLLGTLLCLEFRPGTCLYVLPTDTLASRAVKKRLMPLLQANKQYENYMPFGQFSLAESIPLKGFPVYFTGSRTAAKLASVPANLVIIDEAEKLQRPTKEESDPISLALERTKSYADSLVVLASTPTVAGTKFQAMFEEGSRSHFTVPCPHCGNWMEYKFERDTVRWDSGEPSTARIVCPHCQGSINDNQRREAMRSGKWVDANPDARKRGMLSFHLNSLYSPFLSIAEVAQKYHDAANSVTKESDLQNFHQSWLAQPWEKYLQKVHDADVKACIDQTYHRGTLPLDYKLMVLGVDPGQNESHWVVSALMADGSLTVVDWGELGNIVTTPDNAGVAALFDGLRYKDNAGNEYRPDICLIDAGYRTQEVYDECMRATVPGTIIPTKGNASTIGNWSRVAIRTMPDAPFQLYLYSDFQIKRQLYLDLLKNKRVVLPAESDDSLLLGLSGQELQRTSSGKLRFKEVASDHKGDALKVAVLMSWIMAAEGNPLY